MPNWLWRSIAAVSGTVALMALLQWASCTFWVLPRSSALQGQPAGQAHGAPALALGCDDPGTKATAALMALLTTLISLSRQADDRRPDGH